MLGAEVVKCITALASYDMDEVYEYSDIIGRECRWCHAKVLYCNISEENPAMHMHHHVSVCPVSAARQFLAQNGTPMRRWRVNFEALRTHSYGPPSVQKGWWFVWQALQPTEDELIQTVNLNFASDGQYSVDVKKAWIESNVAYVV